MQSFLMDRNEGRGEKKKGRRKGRKEKADEPVIQKGEGTGRAWREA